MTRHPSMQLVPSPGCVVEFMQGNEPHIAWVEEASGDKLRLYTLNKRETKLPAQRLLPWSGPRFEGGFNREMILEKLKEHEARRKELAASIDPLEIWELAQGEVGQNSAAWFAQLAFDTPDVDHVSAMGRALLGVKTHFKFQPPNFEVYPAETVERRLHEQEASRERELVVTAGQAFFHELWSGWASGRRKDAAKLAAQLDPSAAAKLKALLTGLLADPENQELAALWQQLKKGLPEHPGQALILATEWGVVKPHHNVLLDRAGYDEGDAWSEAFAKDISAVEQAYGARREPASPERFLSIDSPTTRDIDDAFHVEKLPVGWRVLMALARPTFGLDFESDLFKAVCRRASSLYLPEATSHMLPERLGCGLFSLAAGQDSPALILSFTLTPEGEIREFAPSLGFVRVAGNLTYEGVERSLADGTAEDGVRAAFELGGILRAGRVERGAVVLDRPDPKITLSGPPEAISVEITACPDYPMAQTAVSELMILANASVARWAMERELPLLHRVQDISIPPGYAGVWTDPVEMHRVVKQLAGATLEVKPGRHASLAAEAYSPATSPLRRITDLINLAQVEGMITSGAPRFSREELIERLPVISARLDAVSQVQRFRPRYWKLVHMREHCREREFEAVVLEENGPVVGLSLTGLQMYARAGRDAFAQKPEIGQRLLVKVGKVDPLTNEFRILSAREAGEKPDDAEWPPRLD